MDKKEADKILQELGEQVKEYWNKSFYPINKTNDMIFEKQITDYLKQLEKENKIIRKEENTNYIKQTENGIIIDLLEYVNGMNIPNEQKEQYLANFNNCSCDDLIFIYENDKIKEVQYKEPMEKVYIEFTINPKENEVI